MSYKFIIEDQGIYTIFSGLLTSHDLINSNNEIYQTPNFSNQKYQLLNFNNVKEFPVESSAVRTVAEQDSIYYKINPNLKVAIVANTQVVKGLTNMYKTYFELSNNETSWEIEYFETEEAARAWVNA